MIAIEDVQSTVNAQLSAHPYLTGLYIASDTGLVENEIQRALGDDGQGVALVVSFPTGGQVIDGAKNLASEDVGITVTARLNPQVNETGAGKNLLVLLRSIREAVMGWVAPNNDRLTFRPAGWEFAWEIEGEIGYYIHFVIRAAFNNPQ